MKIIESHLIHYCIDAIAGERTTSEDAPSDTQICVEGVSDDDNNGVDSDAAYPSDSTQEAFYDY